MTDRTQVIVAALLMMVAVAAGAYGAHGLQQHVSTDLIPIWNTAVQYHLIHGVALLGLAWATQRFGGALLRWAAALMLLGVLLFSGSLYLLVLSGTRILGAITPLGGMALILAWALVAVAAWKQP